MFGLTAKQWAVVTALVLEPSKAAGAKVFVYGSRAQGRQRKFSDLDITVVGAVSDEMLALIRHELEESKLSVKVELVRWEELPETYQPRILSERVEV